MYDVIQPICVDPDPMKDADPDGKRMFVTENKELPVSTVLRSQKIVHTVCITFFNIIGDCFNACYNYLRFFTRWIRISIRHNSNPGYVDDNVYRMQIHGH